MTTKKTSKKLTKSKSKMTYKEIISSLFSFTTFKDKEISKKRLAIYNLIILLIITTIAIISNNVENYSSLNDLELGSYTLIGLPLLILILYGIFYVFLNAFENNNKPFIETMLIISTITFPFFLIGNLLNLIAKIIINTTYNIIFQYVVILLLIYYVVLFILNIKNYYKTSCYKIITSITLLNIVMIGITLIQYLNYLIKLTQ